MSKCSCISAGDFRNRITVQSITETADTYGGFTRVWDDTISLWAKIKPLSGFERAQGKQLDAGVSHKITTRYQAGITSKQRIKYDNRYFNITSIINVDEENRFLEILALESSEAAI